MQYFGNFASQNIYYWSKLSSFTHSHLFSLACIIKFRRKWMRPCLVLLVYIMLNVHMYLHKIWIDFQIDDSNQAQTSNILQFLNLKIVPLHRYYINFILVLPHYCSIWNFDIPFFLFASLPQQYNSTHLIQTGQITHNEWMEIWTITFYFIFWICAYIQINEWVLTIPTSRV